MNTSPFLNPLLQISRPICNFILFIEKRRVDRFMGSPGAFKVQDPQRISKKRTRRVFKIFIWFFRFSIEAVRCASGRLFYFLENSLQIICTVQKWYLPLGYQTAKANYSPLNLKNMTKRTITNPVTGKTQTIGQDKPNIRLLKLGFDGTGKVVYQETEEQGVPTFRGYLPDAAHFLGFN